MAGAKKLQKPKVKCPQCGAEIELDPKTQEGEIIECPDCGCELEVIKKGNRLDVEAIEETWEEREDLGEAEESEDFE
jgi:alpha-aminoadipate carrier protein LysW